MKIRARMSKGEAIRFISHLDYARAIQRAVRRADLPIALTSGFTPRPKISFASALALGNTSDSEYVDFELRDYMPVKQFSERLNRELPEGIQVTAVRPIPDNSPSLTAAIVAASYEVIGQIEAVSFDSVNALWNTFLEQPEIVMLKTSKRTTKEIDIKPLIMKAEICSGKVGYCWDMLLASGQLGNLRPEQLLDAFFSYADIKGAILKIHRTELFIDSHGHLTSPLARSRLSLEAGEL